jgi:hypothetical protein
MNDLGTLLHETPSLASIPYIHVGPFKTLVFQVFLFAVQINRPVQTIV